MGGCGTFGRRHRIAQVGEVRRPICQLLAAMELIRRAQPSTAGVPPASAPVRPPVGAATLQARLDRQWSAGQLHVDADVVEPVDTQDLKS